MLPKFFLAGARVGLDWISMVLLILVAVAARGLRLVFHAAGLGCRVAGLGDRVAKYRFD